MRSPSNVFARRSAIPELAFEMMQRAEAHRPLSTSDAELISTTKVRRFEIDLIRRALDQTGGHQSRAARLLGLNATTLNSKIKTVQHPYAASENW
jgi:DNA-binding NtrC family response regulator